MRRTEIVAEAKNLFQCSEARITTPTRGRHFLIIGYAKTAQWYTGTEEGVTALTVPYVDERCIASGRSYRELREEMLECHRLSQLGDAELMEHILGLGNGAGCSLSSHAALKPLLRNGSLSKTSPDCCPPTEDGTWLPSSGRWENSGMGGPTGCLTLSTTTWHSGASVC